MRKIEESTLTKTGRLYPDELVVGLPHLDKVTEMLDSKLDAPSDVTGKSPELGVALLQLKDAEAAAAKLRTRPDTDQLPEPVRKAIAAHEGDPALDLVMNVLRGWFESEYAGWTPVLGKNRLIRGVEGLPEIGGGGEGDLTPRDPFHLPGRTARVNDRIKVGLLDTPIFRHPELEGRYAAPPDAVLDQAFLRKKTPHHLAGHATFLAGVILQQAPDADLDVRKVLDVETGTASAWDVATEMAKFSSSGVQILNMSFGCATDDGEPPLLLVRAVELLSPDIVLVAAAGNHGSVVKREPDAEGFPSLTPSTPYWPAALQDVWAIGALNVDCRAHFSPDLPWVDLTAPGVDISSTYLPGTVDVPERDKDRHITGHKLEEFGDGYATWGGTSAAAAVVTGELAAEAQKRSTSAREALKFLLARSARGPGPNCPDVQTAS